MPARFLTYQCRHCPRQGRRYRMLAHVLKEHIPLSRVPYYCTLCNFRCQEAKTLEEHITNYAPHRKEEARQGVPDYGSVLKYNTDPAKVEDFFYVLATDGVPAEKVQESSELINRHGRILPRWVVDRNLPQPPSVTRQSASPAPEYVPTPVSTLSMPMLSFDALLDDSPFSEEDLLSPEQQGPSTMGASGTSARVDTTLAQKPFSINQEMASLGQAPLRAAVVTPGPTSSTTMCQAPSATVVTPGPSPSAAICQAPLRAAVMTPVQALGAATRKSQSTIPRATTTAKDGIVATGFLSGPQTPVLDEHPAYCLLPTAADRNDPLLIEEENSKRKQDGVDCPTPCKLSPPSTEDIIADAVTRGTAQICKALEEQQNTMKALQQAMTRQADESARLERRVTAILRYLQDNVKVDRRSTNSPKIKSAVFKRR